MSLISRLFLLTSYSSAYDPDELLVEQKHRQMVREANARYKNFVTKVGKFGEEMQLSLFTLLFASQAEELIAKDTSRLSFEIPAPELGFFGVPQKEMVFLQPCNQCIVNLTERPVRSSSL